MATISSSFYRDANRVPITTGGLITKKTVTFAGGTTDAWGDDGGALDGGVVFTVTGTVIAQVIGVCKTSLAGGATVELGITGATAIFGKKITDTDLDAGQLYVNETAATYMIIGEENAAADNLPTYLLNGNDIILTTTTTNTTSGVIDFYCVWIPISDDANVEASSN
jgi:hypothetical protein